jgi:hypothetical protein
MCNTRLSREPRRERSGRDVAGRLQLIWRASARQRSGHFAAPVILRVETGDPIVILAGEHVGCFELLGRDDVRSIRDLKGRTVAVPGLDPSPYAFLASMAAHVGLDPRTDINWVKHPASESMQLLADGKIDAYLGFPTAPQELRAKRIGRVVVNSGRRTAARRTDPNARGHIVIRTGRPALAETPARDGGATAGPSRLRERQIDEPVLREAGTQGDVEQASLAAREDGWHAGERLRQLAVPADEPKSARALGDERAAVRRNASAHGCSSPVATLVSRAGNGTSFGVGELAETHRPDDPKSCAGC